MKYTGKSTQVRTAPLPGKLTPCKEALNNGGRSQYFSPLNSHRGGSHLVEHDFPSFFYYRKPWALR